MCKATSIIIPCYDDAKVLPNCLTALFKQIFNGPVPEVEIIVACNGCSDDSAQIARGHAAEAAAVGWKLDVLELEQPSKPGALNAADALACGEIRIYLDADVVCSPTLVQEILDALAIDAARYAIGTIRIPRAASWISRRYARFWSNLPSVCVDVYGIGLYAVNAAGRARWEEFPPIHSDDTFVRSRFSAVECVRCPAPYDWPVPEGARNILNVRLRWTEGNAEFVRLFERDKPTARWRDKRLAAYARLLLRMPVSAAVFTAVYVLSYVFADRRVTTSRKAWRRAR